MRVGGTFPHAKLESHSDLGNGEAEIRWDRVETQKRDGVKLVSGTM